LSFILDALRKAEAERARGQVPGLQTPVTLVAADAQRAAASPGPSRWAWIGIGVAAGMLAAASAAWLLGDAPRQPAPADASLAPPAVAPAAPVAAAPPTSRIALPPAPPPPPAPLAAAPGALQPPAQPPAPAPTAPALSATQTRTPAAATELPAAPAAANTRWLRPAELPEATRRQLPPLQLGGSVWSAQPESRFVIIDGQLLREGESVAAGLVVESIGQRAVRLRWRDRGIELPL
jgi:general secretion pathway protein B